MIGDCMTIYEKIVERYQWDALDVFWPWSDPDGVRAAKATFGNKLTGCRVGLLINFNVPVLTKGIKRMVL